MPPSTPSRAWKYFTRSNDNKRATCNLCKQQFTYSGGTSNLLSHLETQHPAAASKEERKQTSLTAFVTTPTKTRTETERITQAIADMIISDYGPLSIVEGEGFKRLMEIVAPGYIVPCRKTVRSRILRRYDTERDSLAADLQDVASVAITTDTWTSVSSESYITVTEHHLSDSWELKSNVLMTRTMPERHTRENLANRLKDCVSEFNMTGKVETCVHDNARNMESAGTLCDEWDDLGCFGHTMQLCLKPALDLPSVSKVVARCRKLVGHFKHSTTLTAEMKARQMALGVKQHSLVQDVPTRWNSTYAMMERVTEQRRVVTDILLDSNFTKKADMVLNLKDCEWELISELCDVLRAFADVTEYMSTERFVSVSEIFPIVCGLVNNQLINSDSDSAIVRKLKEMLREEVVRRYQPTSDEAAKSKAALASLLDPRYKKLPFFSSHQRRITHELLESRLDDLPLKTSMREQHCTDEQPSKRRKLDFIVFDSPEGSPEDEIQCFLSEKMVSDTDPLRWWRQNEDRFPKIASVARKVLAVPATSVPSERIFSTAGLLLNKLRNQLSSDIVDSIIFLSKNEVKLCDSDLEELN